ncbi:MAG: sialidase, partial [Gemmatimonadetes bacterium]|nr:sialidase [Gemmatimonadota bacterium]
MCRPSGRPRLVEVLLVSLLSPFLFVHAASAAQQIDPARYSQLQFRHIGPVGNRLAAVTGVVGDRLTYYVGAASGGIWKTVDGGENWEPIFDDQIDHSIGALAVAPSDPAIVWAGTGEPHIRSNVSLGTGVYKSTNGGTTWQHMGLGDGGPTRVSRIVIHPTNPNIVYVAMLGHSHGPQRARGIYRTTDGGRTWQQVLFANENTGASSLEMDPSNPRKLFAGLWNIEVHTWGRESGGEGSGIYMTLDGGDTWRKLEGNGLPRPPAGKTDVCLTPADPNRVYALIETGDGVPWKGQETDQGQLWRSDNGGQSWALMTHDRTFRSRTGYYNNCFVSTDDRDEVYFLT